MCADRKFGILNSTVDRAQKGFVSLSAEGFTGPDTRMSRPGNVYENVGVFGNENTRPALIIRLLYTNTCYQHPLIGVFHAVRAMVNDQYPGIEFEQILVNKGEVHNYVSPSSPQYNTRDVEPRRDIGASQYEQKGHCRSCETCSDDSSVGLGGVGDFTYVPYPRVIKIRRNGDVLFYDGATEPGAFYDWVMNEALLNNTQPK